MKSQPSIERSESLPQGGAGVGGGGHLIYQSPPSHDGEDETMENKVREYSMFASFFLFLGVAIGLQTYIVNCHLKFGQLSLAANSSNVRLC